MELSREKEPRSKSVTYETTEFMDLIQMVSPYYRCKQTINARDNENLAFNDSENVYLDKEEDRETVFA